MFLGRDITSTPDYSDEVAANIDAEVRRLIDSAHDVALGVLIDNREVLDRLARELIDHETLETERVQGIFGDVRMWDGRPADTEGRSHRRPETAAPAPGRTSAAAATQTEPQHRGGPT